MPGVLLYAIVMTTAIPVNGALHEFGRRANPDGKTGLSVQSTRRVASNWKKGS